MAGVITQPTKCPDLKKSNSLYKMCFLKSFPDINEKCIHFTGKSHLPHTLTTYYLTVSKSKVALHVLSSSKLIIAWHHQYPLCYCWFNAGFNYVRKVQKTGILFILGQERFRHIWAKCRQMRLAEMGHLGRYGWVGRKGLFLCCMTESTFHFPNGKSRENQWNVSDRIATKVD